MERPHAGLRSPWLVSLLLVALSFAVYAQVRHHEFVNYDDRIYVVENPNLRQPLDAQSVVRAFTEPYEANWIPLTWLSLHLDYRLHGLDPAGFLLTNVALHALAAVVLFLALLRMTGAAAPSAFVAAVFAVHPLHVESVAWTSERKDVLSGLFWMLAVWAYAGYAARPGLLRYALVTVFLALGLLAKATLVTLPFALLLLDYWPLGRMRSDPERRLPERARLRALVIEKLPWLALALAVSVVTFLVQRDRGAMAVMELLPLDVRAANALESYVVYLGQSLWPAGLAPFYAHRLALPPNAQIAVWAAALLAISAFAGYAARARPYLAVGWLWYLGTLVPMIGLVQVGLQARADRYMYVPLIGLSLAVAWGGYELARSGAGRRRVVAALGVAAVCLLGFLAWRQVPYWRDTIALNQRIVALDPDNHVGHHGLAGAFLLDGRLDEAERHFRMALHLRPRWHRAHSGMGDLYAERGDLRAAEKAYLRSLELNPRRPRTYMQLGRLYSQLGRHEEAVKHLRQSLRRVRRSEAAELRALLAGELAELGRLDEAVLQFRNAVAARPDFAQAHEKLGYTLIRARRFDEARPHLEQALALGGESANLHAGLAEVAQRQGRHADAVAHHRAALALDPELIGAANNLAWLLASSPDAALRDPAEAVALAEATSRRALGGHVEILDTLAAAYAAAGRFDAAVRTAESALAQARARRDEAVVAEVEARLALYRAGQPFVDGR